MTFAAENAKRFQANTFNGEIASCKTSDISFVSEIHLLLAPSAAITVGTVGRVPTDGQVDSGATLTGPRERERRESTIAGPGPSQPPPHQNYRLDAVKLMTLYTFHIMDFSFIVAPASYHAHSFLAALFVYSLCVPTFS